MVRVILDTYIEGTTERETHIRYDKNNLNDQIIMAKLNDLVHNEQPLCDNCVNYYLEGYFCGYRAHCCKIHGCLEGYDHPHRDGDGSKCPDYMKQTKTASEIHEQERDLHTLRVQSEEERMRLAPFEEKLKKLKENNNDT